MILKCVVMPILAGILLDGRFQLLWFNGKIQMKGNNGMIIYRWNFNDVYWRMMSIHQASNISFSKHVFFYTLKLPTIPGVFSIVLSSPVSYRILNSLYLQVEFYWRPVLSSPNCKKKLAKLWAMTNEII